MARTSNWRLLTIARSVVSGTPSRMICSRSLTLFLAVATAVVKQLMDLFVGRLPVIPERLGQRANKAQANGCGVWHRAARPEENTLLAAI